MHNSTDRRRFMKGMAAGATGLVTAAASPLIASSSPARIDVFLGTFGRAADLNLEFAEKMPAEHYSFKPTPEIRSYAGQLLHVAGSNAWFTGTYVLGTGAPDINFEPEDPSKEQVIALMKQSDEYVQSSLSGLSDEVLAEEVETFAGVISKETVCWLMRDHITHHRGQMIVYLRLKGLEPPAYVGT